MGFTEPCFADTDDDMIDQALGSTSNSTKSPTQSPDKSWFANVTRQRLERENHIPLPLPANADGRILPFSTPGWFSGTPTGRGELTPVLPLIRMGRGMMMGVDHNKNLEWVGSSAALVA